jgi:Flp pilus assembly protein TadG
MLNALRSSQARLLRRGLSNSAPGLEGAALGRSLRGSIVAFLRSCDAGNSLIEFALVFPILLTVVTGIWQLGVFYSDMIAMTQGVTAGAQVLQSDRLSSNDDPCADTYSAVINAAPRLVASKVTVTISMNGNTAVTGNSCSGKQTQLAMGGPVTVKVSYPYSISIYGFAFASGNMNSGTVSETEY